MMVIVPVVMAMIMRMVMPVIVIMRVPVVVIVRMGVVTVAMVMPVPVFEDGLHAGGHRNCALGLRIQNLAEQQHHRRSEEREQGNQPDCV